MNTIRINGNNYKFEFYWKLKKNSNYYDSKHKPLLFPKHSNKLWSDKKIFLQYLEETQRTLYSENKYKPYPNKEYQHCLICKKKNIITGVYTINNIKWETGVKHYIRKHNIKPSDEFIDFIYRFTNNLKKGSKLIGKINGLKIIKNEKKYLKIDKNQILIMDALMTHGSSKSYIDNKKIYRYSEHAGLLDFNNTGLEKIIISANTTKVDPNDDDIYLPRNIFDALDYEYIFHTHPPTPSPGSRMTYGILYEFPSVSDMFHFIDHYNDGTTQGSIVIAPEGMYIVRKFIVDNKKIIINEDKFYNEITNVLQNCQKHAILKYQLNFNLDRFYSVIAQDYSYINKINKILHKFKLHIDYYSRFKDDQGNWIIDSLYLPVYVTELKK